MLLGEITYKVGQKHRLALPKKFRAGIGQQLVITRGYEGCLVVVGQNSWQQLMADVENGSFLDVNARESARFLFGGASEVELDNQGRFIVPAALYDHAGLSDEVVFVGVGKWLEIWSRQRWDEQLVQLSQRGSVIAQHLINKEGAG